MAITTRSFGTHSAAAGAAGVLVAAAAFIAPWEGYFGKTYRDIVGVPTVCYGITAADTPILGYDAVKAGTQRTFSKPECQAMLAKALVTYDAKMMACLKRPITDNMHVAFLSMSYNVGVAGFCKSSVAKRANAGDFKGACDALMAWDKAGGRVVKGLENRRSDERELCLKGL